MIQAAARRRMMWFDMSRQSAGGTADGGCIGHASPAITDTLEATCADPNLSAHSATSQAPDTPAPMSAAATPSQSNGHQPT